MTVPVPPRHRLALALLCGLVAGAVTVQSNANKPFARDIGQVWFAARAVLSGLDPYPLVGPGLAYDWWPLLYPLPAAIIAIPLAPFSRDVASVLFMIVGGACFAWALMEHGYGTLFGFFAAPMRFAAEVGQWSPLFAAALIVPPLAIFWVAKPTIGLAMFAGRPTRWAVVGAIVFGGIAFAVQPGWVGEWLAAIRLNNELWAPARPYRIPLLFPGGVVALVALLRWRRPEARLIAALACVPQTPMLYEAAPLLLVPRTFWQSALLVFSGYAGHYIVQAMLPSPHTQPVEMAMSGQMIVFALYLPCVVMVLRRPNA